MPNAKPIVYEFDEGMEYVCNYSLERAEKGDKKYSPLRYNEEATEESSDEID